MKKTTNPRAAAAAALEESRALEADAKSKSAHACALETELVDRFHPQSPPLAKRVEIVRAKMASWEAADVARRYAITTSILLSAAGLAEGNPCECAADGRVLRDDLQELVSTPAKFVARVEEYEVSKKALDAERRAANLPAPVTFARPQVITYGGYMPLDRVDPQSFLDRLVAWLDAPPVMPPESAYLAPLRYELRELLAQIGRDVEKEEAARARAETFDHRRATIEELDRKTAAARHEELLEEKRAEEDRMTALAAKGEAAL